MNYMAALQLQMVRNIDSSVIKFDPSPEPTLLSETQSKVYHRMFCPMNQSSRLSQRIPRLWTRDPLRSTWSVTAPTRGQPSQQVMYKRTKMKIRPTAYSDVVTGVEALRNKIQRTEVAVG